jgi:hypothetical protein
MKHPDRWIYYLFEYSTILQHAFILSRDETKPDNHDYQLVYSMEPTVASPQYQQLEAFRHPPCKDASYFMTYYLNVKNPTAPAREHRYYCEEGRTTINKRQNSEP